MSGARVHPKPSLARQGLRIVTPADRTVTAAMAVRANQASAAAQSGRSPLADLFPGSITVLGGFYKIPVVSVFNYAAGLSAWYPLIDVDVDAEFGSEVALWGVRIEQRPTDNAGSVGGAWGTSRGLEAAIVVGRDFPITNEGDGFWQAAPPPISGIENATATYDAVRSRIGNVYESILFPPGDFSDAVPQVRRSSMGFGAMVYRIPAGSRLCAALVCKGATINALAPLGNIVGSVNIQLHCLDTNAQARFIG